MELTGSEELDVEQLARLATPRTRLISLVHVSNMLGCVLPVHKVAEIAQSVGARLLLDCCQSGEQQGVRAARHGGCEQGWRAGAGGWDCGVVNGQRSRRCGLPWRRHLAPVNG